MSFVRLKRGNDWGTEFFYRPDRGGGPGDRSKGCVFTEGAQIGIRWPDGSMTTERVKHRKVSTSVSDHGHTYGVEYEIAGIETVNRGVTSWVPLDAVEVDDDTIGRVNS